jgi:hypothetical protein
MISIVCIYNNRETLDKYLMKSLQSQNTAYEFIGVDNRAFAYVSAASGLNEGAKSATGDYIMFVHQDVIIPSRDWLGLVEKRLNTLSGLGIAGVAGRKRGSGVISNIYHCDPPTEVGPDHIKTSLKVETVDECLVLVPRHIFEKIRFDEKVCDDWHLYAVDFCLECLSCGLNVYVIPDMVYHVSSGSTKWGYGLKDLVTCNVYSPGYYKSLRKVLKKYRKRFDVIHTTCGTWYTSIPVSLQKIIYKYPSIHKLIIKIDARISRPLSG